MTKWSFMLSLNYANLKKALCLLVFIIKVFEVNAQNLVINGDFEDFINCPTGSSEMFNCVGWQQPSGPTSDYYNACSISAMVNVPNASPGYQLANSGSAFAGIIEYQWAGTMDTSSF